MADEIKTAKAESTGVVNLDLAVATTEAISSDPSAVSAITNPNDVTFTVKYGKDYKGDKVMPEGNVIVSKESAAHFESLGIGKTVK